MLCMICRARSSIGDLGWMGGLHGEGIELFFVLGGWHTELDLSLDFALVFVVSYIFVCFVVITLLHVLLDM